MTLQHVSLETDPADGDAEAAFWAVLGFAEVTPPESLRERARWLQAGATQIHLLFTDDPHTVPRGHVAVVVEDYDALAAQLGDALEPRTQHWGVPRGYVRSPGGHLVEVMAAPPPP